MIGITMMIPTRGRGVWLPALCENLLDTCGVEGNFEVMFVWDEDDVATGDWLEICRGRYPTLNMRVLHRPHSDNLSEDYFNWMLRVGRPRGHVYWATGDDVRLHTQGWDIRVLRGIEEYFEDKPDRIGLCFAQDKYTTDKGFYGFDWGCFPILTKETYELLGWFFPQEFVTWEADGVMAKMFHDPRVNRLHMIEDVVIDQLSYHAHPEVGKDETVLSVIARHNNPLYREMRMHYMNNVLEQDIRRLERGIRERVDAGKPV